MGSSFAPGERQFSEDGFDVYSIEETGGVWRRIGESLRGLRFFKYATHR